MEFHAFNAILQRHFESFTKNEPRLYEVDVNRDELWESYLNAFPAGTNEIFRKKREFDCSCCRSFVKQFGNVVAIVGNKKVSIWDFQVGNTTYQPVVDAISKIIHAAPISSVFVSKLTHYGVEKNLDPNEGGKPITWNHFFLKLPAKFVNRASDSDGTIRGEQTDLKTSLRRSLEEINGDSVSAILELIAQNTLYKGEEFKHLLEKFQVTQTAFKLLSKEEEKELFCWVQSPLVGGAVCKLRTAMIGTLLIDVSNGEPLDAAVTSYERKAAPSNYKRPKAIFSQKMLDEAKKTLEKEGLLGSLERRSATLQDITVRNTIYVNRNVVRKLLNDPFEGLAANVQKNPKAFEKVEEVPIEKFIKDILPKSNNLELFFENKHASNMVSLIAPKNSEAPSLFKWDNAFSWSYRGNITDSMKERVKAAGGKVDGVLRFSIQWNENELNQNDFDAHCVEPDKNHISYMNKHGHKSSGDLDVDIISPIKDVPAVENITWSDIKKMKEGEYTFYVNTFSSRGGRDGFRAEIEFDGQIFQFEFPNATKSGQNVVVAKVEYSKKNGFEIVESLDSKQSSKTVWGIQTNNFVPVSISMFSPNYWDEQQGIGHKHYFFMLNGCVSDEQHNGFYNEFLKESFDKHRKVFEALGSKMKVDISPDQLSGVGFSSTKRDVAVFKVEGQTSRVIKVVF